ncbi:MAG: hypothetical protein M1133_09365 [Armatimonadetes bacterium]|nr:hypothetical protein [Armatimonadota bacterium]
MKLKLTIAIGALLTVLAGSCWGLSTGLRNGSFEQWYFVPDWGPFASEWTAIWDTADPDLPAGYFREGVNTWADPRRYDGDRFVQMGQPKWWCGIQQFLPALNTVEPNTVYTLSVYVAKDDTPPGDPERPFKGGSLNLYLLTTPESFDGLYDTVTTTIPEITGAGYNWTKYSVSFNSADYPEWVGRYFGMSIIANSGEGTATTMCLDKVEFNAPVYNYSDVTADWNNTNSDASIWSYREVDTIGGPSALLAGPDTFGHPSFGPQDMFSLYMTVGHNPSDTPKFMYPGYGNPEQPAFSYSTGFEGENFPANNLLGVDAGTAEGWYYTWAVSDTPIVFAGIGLNDSQGVEMNEGQWAQTAVTYHFIDPVTSSHKEVTAAGGDTITASIAIKNLNPVSPATVNNIIGFFGPELPTGSYAGWAQCDSMMGTIEIHKYSATKPREIHIHAAQDILVMDPQNPSEAYSWDPDQWYRVNATAHFSQGSSLWDTIEFSLDLLNPDGTLQQANLWSSGILAAKHTQQSLYTGANLTVERAQLDDFNVVQSGTPVAFVEPDRGAYVRPGEVWLYPGSDSVNKKAVVRWKAMYPAKIKIYANFTGNHMPTSESDPGTTTQVYVAKNGTALWDAPINGFIGANLSAIGGPVVPGKGPNPMQIYSSDVINVNTGDTIDFVCDQGSDFTGYNAPWLSDITGLNALVGVVERLRWDAAADWGIPGSPLTPVNGDWSYRESTSLGGNAYLMPNSETISHASFGPQEDFYSYGRIGKNTSGGDCYLYPPYAGVTDMYAYVPAGQMWMETTRDDGKKWAVLRWTAPRAVEVKANATFTALSIPDLTGEGTTSHVYVLKNSVPLWDAPVDGFIGATLQTSGGPVVIPQSGTSPVQSYTSGVIAAVAGDTIDFVVDYGDSYATGAVWMGDITGVTVTIEVPTAEPPVVVSGITELKGIADGTTVAISTPVVVTVDSKDASYSFADRSFYVEQSDRAAGIKVMPGTSGAQVSVGDVITFTGVVHTDATTGEKWVELTSIDSQIGGTPLDPLGVVNKSVSSSTGLGMTGLLVRVWGKVIDRATDGSYVYIDDGSGGNGIKVVAGAGASLSPTDPVVLPGIGSYVGVTGLASQAGAAVPVVLPRAGADVNTF